MIEKLSLTELQLIIKDSLYLALPDMYWVIAEISEIKENYAGHCYLELIEKHPDETNVRARAKAIIWNKRYRFLKSFFENITGESLKEGQKVLIKVNIEYHEIYGLSLVISDIDPTFTMGEMAIKRQLIIKQLEQEGVFSMNKELKFPPLPKRIAIISSKNAAGYSDFINHLTKNNYGYTFNTALFEAPMQGTETENGIIRALDRIAGSIEFFDIIVIIRGGGSQADLKWFDNYNIAYHVTQFPLPVITGIGHDKDMSVTDMVAFQSLKTPTAVADYLLNLMVLAETHIKDLSSEIADNSKIIIEQNKKRIETCKMKIIPVARIMISDIKEKLSGKIIDIINIGKDFIIREELTPANQKSRLLSSIRSFSSVKESYLRQITLNLKNLTITILNRNNIKTAGLVNTLNILSPLNVLKRGYTITSLNSRILKKSDQVKKDDLIDTQFINGRLRSRVVEKNGGKGGFIQNKR